MRDESRVGHGAGTSLESEKRQLAKYTGPAYRNGHALGRAAENHAIMAAPGVTDLGPRTQGFTWTEAPGS